jgi:protein-disulfide isomerase
VWPQLQKDYVETGKLKFVFRDFPLESIHRYAFKAAEAAHCASEQGKFWEMHDWLYANQKALSPSDLLTHAQAVGLDVPKFQQCLETGNYATKIRKDMADGQQAGVRSTPTFLLGLTEPKDPKKVKVVQVIRGAKPYADFKQAIDRLLASPSNKGS